MTAGLRFVFTPVSEPLRKDSAMPNPRVSPSGTVRLPAATASAAAIIARAKREVAADRERLAKAKKAKTAGGQVLVYDENGKVLGSVDPADLTTFPDSSAPAAPAAPAAASAPLAKALRAAAAGFAPLPESAGRDARSAQEAFFKIRARTLGTDAARAQRNLLNRGGKG